MEDWLASGVQHLQGVGPSTVKKLAKLDITTQRDLLFHLPLRYQDRTRITAISSLQVGQSALVQAEVLSTMSHFRRQAASRQLLIARLTDHSGVLTIRLFSCNTRQQKILAKGNWLRCFGEVRWAQGEMEMVHPEVEVININQAKPLAQNLTPVYPTTEGLHQISMRKIITQVIDHLQQSDIDETLPQTWLSQHHFPDFKSAMLSLHRPTSHDDMRLIASCDHPAQYRFIIEELCAHRLALLARRVEIRARETLQIKSSDSWQKRLLKNLPFQLTGAQQRAVEALMQDFAHGKPMMRLLQGDVGSGKTIVAALACLPVIQSGFQCAFMAPTEILAEQHLQNLLTWFKPMDITVLSLLGADKGRKRAAKLAKIANGAATVIVGTHALFQASVEFQSLAFIIIDEQHRFGVDQRLALRKKTMGGKMPHQLIMTATPIPRTLAMSVYADLDYTKINELPPGRKPVTTSMVSELQRHSLINRVADVCQQGSQVYWVCTLIETSDVLQCEAAEATYQDLQQQLPQLTIALVHGRMKAAEKESIIQDFKNGKTQILVATTVIEVGVDVPNASIMIIENPERLGLSQIHQLRGRIGRGSRKSYCILLVKNNLSETSRQRLDIIRHYQDGFQIAEKDLELRGTGEVLGTRQTGAAGFRIVDILRDRKWFSEAVKLTELIQQNRYAAMRRQLLKNWIGNRQNYIEVG